MTGAQAAPITSMLVEAEEGREDDGPFFAYLPPEDRLWRHPSEVGAGAARAVAAFRTASGGRTWTVALVAGVLGALLASGVGLATGMFLQHTVLVGVPLPSSKSSNVTESTLYTNGGWPAVANDLAPSLVALTVGGQVASAIVYGGNADTTYLITAADAVSGGGRITATFDDGSRGRAFLVGADPATGVAVLRVQMTGGVPAFGSAADLQPTFGSASDLRVADPVMVVGAAGAGVATAGPASVSSLDTPLDMSAGYTLHGMMAVSDLTIPAGANGGALVTQGGVVVGLDTDLTSVDSTMQGMAFAVPINTAEQVATQLLEGAKPSHPWIGIEGATDVSTTTAGELGILGGAQVAAITPGSAAARAGIRSGDIVTGFAGSPVTSSGVFVSVLAGCHTTERTTIDYLDNGHAHRAAITVGSLPGG